MQHFANSYMKKQVKSLHKRSLNSNSEKYARPISQADRLFTYCQCKPFVPSPPVWDKKLCPINSRHFILPGTQQHSEQELQPSRQIPRFPPHTLPGLPDRGCVGKVGVVSLGSQVSCALFLLFCPNSWQAVLCVTGNGVYCKACLSAHRVL